MVALLIIHFLSRFMEHCTYAYEILNFK